jgi:hypothetical protein
MMRASSEFPLYRWLQSGCQPPFEVVSIASRCLLRARLVRVKIPMLPSYIGFVARIKAILLGSALLALRGPLTSLVGKSGATATLVFPTGNCVPVLVRVVRHRRSFSA